MTYTLTLWTNNLEHARWADLAGVDRIGVDLETLGKAKRQQGLATWISPHVMDDLDRLREVIRNAALFVRCNPLNEDSPRELEDVIARGARIIMQPNFKTIVEVKRFASLVGDRAALVPLIENAAAVDIIPDLQQLGIDEFHVGLNDLSIDLNEANRLAVLTLPIIERIAQLSREHNLRLGLGGLGRAFDSALPVPSDLIYAQHARLRAAGALLARSFFTAEMGEGRFIAEVSRLRARLADWFAAPISALAAAREELAAYRNIPTDR